MCLSTVYYANDTERNRPLAKNITAVTSGEDRVVLIDLLGEKSEVPGVIERIDLVKNYITIKAPVA